MSAKKMLLCGMRLSAVIMTCAIIASCNNAGPEDKPPEIDDNYSKTADSIELVRLNDSLKTADSLKYIGRLDSFMDADTLKYTQILDSLKAADSLEHIRLLNRMKNPVVLGNPDNLVVSELPDNASTAIGYGYDITGKYGNGGYNIAGKEGNIRARVFDIDKLLDDKLISKDNVNQSASGTIDGVTIGEYRRALVNGLSIPDYVKAAAFSDELINAFGRERCESNAYAFATHRFSFSKKAYFINNTDALHNYLTERFQDDIKNRPPRELIAIYGTHVMTGIVLGGRLHYNLSIAKRWLERTTPSIGFYTNIMGGAYLRGRDTVVEMKSYDKSSEEKTIRAYGGGATPAIKLSIGVLDGNLFNEWMSSFDDDNLALVDISTPRTGIYPISHFVADAGKRRALLNEILKYMYDSRFEVREELSNASMFFDTGRRMGASLTNGNNAMSPSYGKTTFNWRIEVESFELAGKQSDGTFDSVKVAVKYTIDENGGDRTIYVKNDTLGFSFGGRKVVGIGSGTLFNSGFYPSAGSWVKIVPDTEIGGSDNATGLIREAYAKAGDREGDVGYHISKLFVEFVEKKPSQDAGITFGKKRVR